ncbi:MAG: hypothetical protein JJT78_00840 [Leptospira sp.]|nr:hypothetical protein [Leptospira sp.]
MNKLTKYSFSNILFSSIAIFLMTLELMSAGSTMSVRERKKIIDSRLKVVREIDEAVGGWNINQSQSRFTAIQQKSDEVYYEKKGNQQAKQFSYLEEDLYGLQMDYSRKMKEYSHDLIETFSRDFYLKTDLNSFKDLNKKEKIQRYFEMAKKEKVQAEKYMRMKNPNLALLSFKRSVVYSFNAFLLTETEVPSQYHIAFQNWMKTSPNFSAGKMVNSGVLVRDED